MEICSKQRIDSIGNYQQELPRGDVFHSSIMRVACQSFSSKIFVKTLEITIKFIFKKSSINICLMPFPSNTRPPHFRVFSCGFKGEVREEVKDRITAIFSVVMIENLNDYCSKD